MDQTRFEQMVARLEVESQNHPTRYQVKVALLAMLGFGVLAAIIGFAGLGLLLLVGVVLAVVFTGGKAAILLVKLGKLLVLLAIPLWVLVKSSFSALFTRLPKPEGLEIDRQQAPALFSAMDQMRQSMRGPRFHHVLITDDLNAAVLQRPVFGLFGWPRNYLILGLPLLESLSPEEALAVVAHEYGHLAGSHSKFGAYIYRLRHTWATISDIAEQWEGWGGKVLQKIVGWYAPYFNAYTFVLARANEYEADAASAELVSPRIAANALKRVNLSAAQQDHFYEKTFELIADQAHPPQDIAERWAHRVREPFDAELSQRWMDQALSRTPGLTDTHPALTQRLNALRLSETEVNAIPAPQAAESAASQWLGSHLTSLREVVQNEWAQRVGQAWRDRHQLIQEQRERLAALDQQAELSTDERCESIQLRIKLDRQSDHLPALIQFNTDHPDHALGLFLEADWRLDHDDETGLALLDRVMKLDNAAIKSACEIAWHFSLKRNQKDQADHYQGLWQQRHQWEMERDRQLNNLRIEDTLQSPAELSPDDLRAIHNNVQKHRQGIKRAYVVRRVIPADPTQETYVIALELTAWASWRNRGHQIVPALLALEWPKHVFICAMTHELKPLRAKVSAIPKAQIPL